MPVVKVSEEMGRRREEAARQRQQEAGGTSTSILTSRTVSVARDQEVVPLGRGQAIIRDQVKWLRVARLHKKCMPHQTLTLICLKIIS